MNTTPIEKQFLRMGSRLKVQEPEPPKRRWWWQPAADYSLDTGVDRHGPHYVLSVPTGMRDDLEANVLQVRPDEKHLLLMVRHGNGDIDRFLCGHDERDWFVAAVPDRVSTVNDAMESLKPAAVHKAQAMAGLNGRERKRRKNKAYRRQGEWFFVPKPGLSFDAGNILVWEPIARSGGKPHQVQLLVRTGGELKYFCQHRPDGLSEEAYAKLLKQRPSAKNWGWRAQRVNPGVFAKGEVRHPDHKTIVLHEWHEVLMNTENKSRTMQHVAFFD